MRLSVQEASQLCCLTAKNERTEFTSNRNLQINRLPLCRSRQIAARLVGSLRALSSRDARLIELVIEMVTFSAHTFIAMLFARVCFN